MGKHLSDAVEGKPKNYIPAIVNLYVINLLDNSYKKLKASDAVKEFSLKDFKYLKYIVDNKIVIQNNFLISKSVSTIPDECKGVE